MTNTNLHAAISALDLTRAEFADLCGVDVNTVYRWLREPGAKGAIPVPPRAERVIEMQREIRRHQDTDGMRWKDGT